MYKHEICEKHQFYFFSNVYAFILFSHLIALDRTSSIMMNRSTENIYPFYILILEYIQLFIIKQEISYRIFVDAYSQIEEIPFYSQFPERFVCLFCHEGLLILPNGFPASFKIVHMSFLFYFVNVNYIEFQMLNQPCIPGINPTGFDLLIYLK